MSTDNDEDNDFQVLWPNGDSMRMSSSDILELPFDYGARIAFTHLVFGWRRYARMTLHKSATDRVLLKVVPVEQCSPATTYASLQ
jgi:hypothetical protein